jgi:hypothetical protein
MPYLEHNINTAINSTQVDLKGFRHPLGFISDSNKSFEAIPANFLTWAAGAGVNQEGISDVSYIHPHYSEKEDYRRFLLMCLSLSLDCTKQQYEAIQQIIKDILKSWKERNEKPESNPGEKIYLRPLDKSCWWGKTVLALVQAFEVPLN